jgi:hypothetical protein
MNTSSMLFMEQRSNEKQGSDADATKVKHDIEELQKTVGGLTGQLTRMEHLLQSIADK